MHYRTVYRRLLEHTKLESVVSRRRVTPNAWYTIAYLANVWLHIELLFDLMKDDHISTLVSMTSLGFV